MKTVSVVIPALNEEGNLPETLGTVVSVLEVAFEDYEIIAVDDGSTDRTAEIIASAAAANGRIRCVTHASPRGFGASYDAGRKLARMRYCVMVHGDNAFDEETLRHFLSHAGKAQVVSGFIENPASRSRMRRLISRLYTWSLNSLFRMNLRYFNGLQIHETNWLQGVNLRSQGFAFQAELLIRALRDGRTHLEIPYRHRERPGGGTSKLFRLRNIVSVFRTIALLHSDVPSHVSSPSGRG